MPKARRRCWRESTQGACDPPTEIADHLAGSEGFAQPRPATGRAARGCNPASRMSSASPLRNRSAVGPMSTNQFGIEEAHPLVPPRRQALRGTTPMQQTPPRADHAAARSSPSLQIASSAAQLLAHVFGVCLAMVRGGGDREEKCERATGHLQPFSLGRIPNHTIEVGGLSIIRRHESSSDDMKGGWVRI